VFNCQEQNQTPFYTFENGFGTVDEVAIKIRIPGYLGDKNGLVAFD
jgi:hypothetical protein